MPDWKWLHGLLSMFPGRGSREDFVAVSKESRDNFDAVSAAQSELIQKLFDDLSGLRNTVREQDEQIRALRRDNQQLHQQHLNCEKSQQALIRRIDELESEVKQLRQKSE